MPRPPRQAGRRGRSCISSRLVAVLTLVSGDNFSLLQRTLLPQFALVE